MRTEADQEVKVTFDKKCTHSEIVKRTVAANLGRQTRSVECLKAPSLKGALGGTPRPATANNELS